MAITNTWAVNQMDCYPELDGETDVVFNVHWTLTASNGTYEASAYGTQAVTLDPDAPFIPFADLTEAEVIGWVVSAMGAERVAQIEAGLAAQIQAQINPPVVAPPLPWATPTSV